MAPNAEYDGAAGLLLLQKAASWQQQQALKPTVIITGCAFHQHRHLIRAQQAQQECVVAASERHPEQHLLDILTDRGYSIPQHNSFERGFYQAPSSKEMADYDLAMGTAVRIGSVQELLRLVEEEGRTLSACNKFGESLAHLACRKGSADVVATILRHGGSLTRCDDLGRVPAHDTCWESRPRWDIVQLHLEADAALLLTRDARGWTPLRYVKRANWAVWRAFLDAVKDRYWPARGGDGTCDCV